MLTVRMVAPWGRECSGSTVVFCFMGHRGRAFSQSHLHGSAHLLYSVGCSQKSLDILVESL